MDKRRKPLWETGEPGVPALPGQEGTCPPHDDWTEPEKWAWEQIRAGRAAVFHAEYGFTDPRDDDAWEKEEVREQRLLSPEFLQAILLHQPWRGALTHVGVNIIGALFEEDIDLANADVPCDLWMAASRAEGEVDLKNATFAKSLALSSSLVGGDLALDMAVVKGGLFMRGLGDQRADFQGEVSLLGAQVSGNVDVSGSSFSDMLALDRVVVKGSLFMRSQGDLQTKFQGEVRLNGVQVGGNVEMDGSLFARELAMDGAVIKGDLFMRSQGEQRAEFKGEVRLLGAQIDGAVDMSGARFCGRLAMDSVVITDGLFLRGSEAPKLDAGHVQLRSIIIDGSTSINGMNLAGTKLPTIIDGWNTIVSNDYDPWPQSMDMSGFVYSDLYGVAERGVAVPVTARPVSWFKNWLGRQKEFSPQPYEQCAKVLRAAGAPDKANAVLYACKERELGQAKGWRKVGLWLMRATIGYGLGARYFRALGWAAGLVFAGFLVALCCGQVDDKPWYWFAGFSMDQLLPVISMSKEFDPKVLSGWPWAYFIFLHKPLGFVLASFVVAGLAGVGQHKTD